MEGQFGIHNSERKFSGILIDQAHEQNNKRVKGQGGITGLSTNESALNCWIVTGAQTAEMLKQFKASIGNVANEHEENEARTMRKVKHSRSSLDLMLKSLL